MKKHVNIILLGVMFLLPAAGLKADLLYYEGFDYGASSGALTDVGSGGGWTGSTNNTYQPTGLSYGNLQVSGGSVRGYAPYTTGQITVNAMSVNITSYTEIWVSLLLAMPTTTPTSGNSAGIAISVTQNSWGSTLSREVGKQWSNTGNYALTGTPITDAPYATVGTNTTFFVYRLSEGSAAEIWVNPGFTMPTAGTGQLIGASIPNLTSVDYVQLSSFALGMNMDEIRIATTFDEVAPQAIPEPSSMVLLLAGGMTALVLRHRLLPRCR